ncbi:S16 family serine protease [Thermococcus waiotapuensis]|uniref:S16 family serine protease n=1 Tax=Thermococcus waiotapuensis TaxID=90909 RepID=A0AAE4T0B9_9EURY|nr:S16 family serine protease [Thermococcus waiotapuensis]MDV3102965.1 S16 family serine protease [Thermococcus waiotapuensis]
MDSRRALISFLLAFIVLGSLFLVPSPVAAQCPSGGNTVVLKAPAVAKTPEGNLVGVATTFVITVAPGSGHVYLETWPLAQVDMQASARLATQIAGRVTGKNMSGYDVFIQVKADTPIIGGPSAGATMTVGIIAALEGWSVRNDVMMTGMINPDGTIGPVGGILEKASAAASAGSKLFLIPQGQRIQVVQETQNRSVGGVIQITTTSEKVDVVEYAKERWGLEVKEVADIYDAVYYFTGHRLPKPEVSPTVVIDTSFLKDDAQQDYQNTTDYYNKVLEELRNSNVDYSTYTALKQALDQAKGIIDGARRDIDSGMYYSALSRDFQARIIIRQVQWYVEVSRPEEVASLLNRVQGELNSTEAFVSNLTIRGYTMLQAVAAAEERVEEAKRSLQDAWRYYYNSDYWDSVGEAAYSYERIQTARFWAELGERFAGGEVIERESLRATARNYIDESSLIATYIESMYGDVLGNDLTSTIEEAEEYYDDGKYSAAIFTAMEARVRGEVFLDTLAIDDMTVLQEKLQEMKEAARTAIGLAQMSGIYPLIAIAYYEFAESYERGNTTEDITNAMTFYQYAKESAGVFLMNPSEKNELPANPFEPSTVSTASSSAPQSKETSTGICGPVAVVAFSLLPLVIKRRR